MAALAEAGRGAAATHPVTVRVRLLRHDGATTVPFELSIVDLIDDPTVEGFVISAHDASAQHDAEHQLSDALSLLTATLDSTADGVLVVDMDGTITGFNRRFSEMWNISSEFVSIGDKATKLSYVLDQLLNPQTFMKRWDELQRKPENESFETLEFKDGRAARADVQAAVGERPDRRPRSGASATSPTASGWRTSSSTGPSTTP